MFAPDLPAPLRLLYVCLRSSHMLFSFVILPCCILYVQSHRETVPLGALGIGFLVAGAVLWGMLYMVLSQFAFPETLLGAVVTTGGLYANGLSSANLGDFNLYFAAYSTAWAALLAQALFFAATTLVAIVPTLQRRFLEGLPQWYTVFLLFCTIALFSFALLLHRPFVHEWQSEPSVWMLIIYAAACTWQVTGEIRTLYVSSAFGEMASKQSENTWNLYESYLPFVVLGMIASLLAAWIAAMWHSQ